MPRKARLEKGAIILLPLQLPLHRVEESTAEISSPCYAAETQTAQGVRGQAEAK
jgi:hypothetical protein